MRKLHLISLALLATPLVLMHACGDDEQPAAPTGTAGSAGSGGSGTAGSGGSGGGGTAGTGGSATGGGGSGTAGKAGSAGSGTAGTGGAKADGGPDGSGGTGGSAAEGGTDAPKSDAPTSDAPTSDAPVGDAPTGDASNTCNGDAASSGGKNCNEYCDLFLANCNSDPVFDAGMVYTNAGDCRSKCNAYSQAQLCCYITHVNNAVGYDAGTSDRSNHCTHAAGNPGQSVCPQRQ